MHDSQETVAAFLAAENARDWRTWESFLSPDVAYELVGGKRIVRGRRNYLKHMRRVYRDLEDWRFTLVEVAASRSTVLVEFRGSGHFSGVHGGMRYEGIPLQLRAVCVFRLRGRRIHRVREYWDAIGFERQLGEANPDYSRSSPALPANRE
ncbi:MAG: nuclear transport factor 2 family protein [Planctomycetes bacterium]|nr:nuclear transport factor 2 family protein [Planctomycetota bacterium]